MGKLSPYFCRLVSSPDSLRGQLVRGGIGNTLVQVTSRLLGLALSIVLARSLGVEGYGVYVYAFALLNLLMIFAELGMPTLLLREVSAKLTHQDWAHLRGLLVRSFQLVFSTSVALAAIAAFVLWQFGEGMPESQSKTLAWVLLLLPLVALTSLMTAALRGLQHVVKTQAVEMLVRPFLALLIVGFLFKFAPEMRLPQYAAAVQLGSSMVVVCIAAVLLYRYLPQPVHTAAIKYQTRHWLACAMPLTLIGGAGIINSQTDILMLGIFRASEEIGIYNIAVQGSVLVAFGLQVANMVIAPQFSRLYSLGEMVRLQRLVTVSARVILLAALPVALIFIAAGDTIVGWAFGPEFTKSYAPLCILVGGQLVNAAMGSVGFLLNMTGHERYVAKTLLITAGLNIVLNFALIPPFGINGAAIATAVSLALWNVLLCRAVKDRLGVNSTAFAINGR